MATRLVSALILLWLAALLLAGCSRPGQDQPVVKAVEEYCSIIQTVYLQLDLKPLAQVATEKELKRVYPIVQALQAANNVMKTEVDAFTVTSVAVSGATATVDTAERWTFWWEERGTGTVTKEKKEENYRLRYALLNQNGAWKVDQVRHLR